MLENFELEQDLVLSDLETMRRFDMECFIESASTSFGNPIVNQSIGLRFQSYGTFLDKSMAELENAKVRFPDTTFALDKLQMTRLDMVTIMMKPLTYQPIIIKPGYLNQYVDNVGFAIQRILKDDQIKELYREMNRYLSSDIMRRVRRQTVSGPLNSAMPIKNLVDTSDDELIPLTKEYCKTEIFPFLQSLPKYIEDVSVTKEQLDRSISYCEETINTYMEVLNEYVENKIGEDKVKLRMKINKTIYNIFRTCFEVISYVTFSFVRKVGYLTTDMCSIQSVIDQIDKASIVETESAFDRGLVVSDSKAVGEGLLRGDVDAFQELATDIYEYNSSLISSSPFHGSAKINGEKLFASVDFETDQEMINEKVYNDTMDMLSIISQGLDVIAKNSDDYLIVFDDILEKSGFSTRLEDRFAGTLNTLDDITEYRSAIVVSDECRPDMNIYYKILREVKEYPERMEKIADLVSECKTKINMLTQRFSKNINQEYSNTMTIRELTNFLENLNDEFTNLSIQIGGKFMIRLKEMAIILEKMNKARSKDLDKNYPKLESTELQRESYQNLVETSEAITDIIFESLLSSYMKEHEWRRSHTKLIFEADEDLTGKGKKLVEGIKNKINTWFEKVSNKIQQISDGVNAKRDKNYFLRNKNSLLQRNYANTTTKNPIIEYEKLMPFANISADMRSLVNKTSTANLSPQRLQNITDQESVARILFTNRPPIDVWKTEKVSDAITKFYKCGTYPENPVELKNNDVKEAVENAVNFCEPFYESFLPQLRSDIEKIKNNLDNVSESLVKESSIDVLLGTLFTEAPEDGNQGTNNAGQNTTGGNNQGGNGGTQQNQPAQQNTQTQATQTNQTSTQNNQSQQNTTQNAVNTVSNMANKVEMIQKMTQQYCNAVLTASFDRYKDYMSLLKSIIADTSQEDNEQTQEPVNNPPQNQNA